MKYLKLFEAFNDLPENIRNNISNIEDITTYIPGQVGGCDHKWCTPDLNLKRILDEEAYINYKGNDKKYYLRYYIVGFLELTNFFKSESNIRHRAKVEGLKFFVINMCDTERNCKILFFTDEDWKKLDMKSLKKNLIENHKLDIIFEEDVKIDKNEFDIIYEDELLLSIKPKTYKAAIKYSSDSFFKAAFKKNLDWINKYLKRGGYYGGFNWYKEKNVTAEVKNWWQKLFNLPGKEKEIQVKDFINDFPRYLLYIVIFKKMPVEDPYSKIFLLYDLSRGEYAELPQSFSSDYVMFGGYWGDMLDAAHNQVKATNTTGKKITLQDIHHNTQYFNRAFHHIEEDFNNEKDKMYDLLGFWADKGGEYAKDALVFVRSDKEPNRLQVTRPSLIKKLDDGRITWTRLGYYDDPNFDYWELDKEKTQDKRAPEHGYKDYFQSIQDDVKKLRDAIDDGDIKF